MTLPKKKTLSNTPSVLICKYYFSLIKECLHIGTEGVHLYNYYYFTLHVLHDKNGSASKFVQLISKHVIKLIEIPIFPNYNINDQVIN